MHACNNNANRGHLKESEKRYMEGFGGREEREERNDINIISKIRENIYIKYRKEKFSVC